MRGRRLIRMLLWALLAGGLAAGFFALCQWMVLRAGKDRLYTRVEEVPPREIGLLLGTGEKLGNGDENFFFTYRIAAAAELYKAGKVRRILASGDNHVREYDEPAMMQRALIAAGVPQEAILLDDAGFRTLDSVVRAREVFGFSQFIIISQRFHNQRALLIADHYGMDAAGYCARDVAVRFSLRTRIREAFARVKAVLDLYVLHTSPKFLGGKEK